MDILDRVVVFAYRAFVWISNNRKQIGTGVGVVFGKEGLDIRRRDVPPRTLVEFWFPRPIVFQTIREAAREVEADDQNVFGNPEVTNRPRNVGIARMSLSRVVAPVRARGGVGRFFISTNK